MLERFRIGTRLGLGFGAILAMATALFAAAVWLSLGGLHATRDATAELDRRLDAVQAMQTAQLEAISTLRNAGLMSNGRAVKAELVFYDQAMARLQEAEAAFAGFPLDAVAKDLLDKAIALRRSAEPVVLEALDLVKSLAGDEGAKVLSLKLSPIQAQWSARLKELSAHEHRHADAVLEAIAATNLRRLGLLAALLATTIAAAALLAVLLTRSVTRPLQRAAEVADAVAQGRLDLRIDVHGRDEAASLLGGLQTMILQLSAMVQAVHESARSIADASGEISRGNQDLSERTERQASSLAETTASMSALAEAVSLNTANADTARALAERTALTADSAGRAMHEVVATMTRISESSRHIADIIGVIDGIAFQTNILALNAAVEAARAGEQGRGFAVVASEVRSLATRVTGAASEVRALITESVGRVDDGSRRVGDMGGTMQQLVDCAGQVKGLVEEIAQASVAQRQSIDSVNGAVREVDSTTQQNAALVEQVTAAAQSLVEQTQALGSVVGRFRLAA